MVRDFIPDEDMELDNILIEGEVEENIEGKFMHRARVPCKPCILKGKKEGEINIYQDIITQSHTYKGVTNHQLRNGVSLFNCSHEQFNCPILRLEARTSKYCFENSKFGSSADVERTKATISRAIKEYEQSKDEQLTPADYKKIAKDQERSIDDRIDDISL